MMQEKKSDEKVVPFVQNRTKIKSFRQNFPISDELRRNLLVEVFPNFRDYALNKYFDIYKPVLSVFINDHELAFSKRSLLEKNLFWWRILFDASMNVTNCVEEYIFHHHRQLYKGPIIISWLHELNSSTPGFYQIGRKLDDMTFILTNLLTNENINVMIDKDMEIPELDTVVFGTIFPIGANVYHPFTTFFPFNYITRVAIKKNLSRYYRIHKDAGNKYETIIHVLSAMLEIERLFSDF